MRSLLLLLMSFIVAVLIVFGIQNPQSAQITFLSFHSGPVSLSLVMMSSALIGALLVICVSIPDHIQRGWARRKSLPEAKAIAARIAGLESQLTALKQENTELRSSARSAHIHTTAPFVDMPQQHNTIALKQA